MSSSFAEDQRRGNRLRGPCRDSSGCGVRDSCFVQGERRERLGAPAWPRTPGNALTSTISGAPSPVSMMSTPYTSQREDRTDLARQSCPPVRQFAERQRQGGRRLRVGQFGAAQRREDLARDRPTACGPSRVRRVNGCTTTGSCAPRRPRARRPRRVVDPGHQVVRGGCAGS